MSPEALAPPRASFDSDVGPSPCADPCLPAEIRAIELTQGIQHLPLDTREGPRANALPLVAGKDLFVRIFVSAAAADASPGFDAAVVTTSRGGPQRRHVAARPLLAQDANGPRTDAASSINVPVPGLSVSSGMALEVSLYRSDAAGGAWEVSATHSMRPRVVDVPPLPVIVVPVKMNVRGVGRRRERKEVPAPADGGTPVVETAARRLPVPSIDIRARTPERTFDVQWKEGPKEVRAALLAQDLATTRDVIVVGIIGPEFVALNPATYGYGGSGVAVALGTDPSVVVHEIGHVLRRRHTACAGAPYDPDYPQRWPRRAGALDDVGFRLGGDDGVGPAEALSPDVYLDYMGAADCRPAWSSAYGWTVAMRGARSRAYRRRPACACTHMLLDVTVTGPDRIALGPSHVVKARPPTPLGPPSAYSVELLDGARVLARRVLHDLDLAEGSTGAFPARFIEAILWNPAATGLRVRHGRRIIDTMQLAAAPPSLANVVVAPDATGAEVELSWDADPDPDVHHLVRFSNDGRDWIALSNDMTENPVLLDLRGLPTGPACVIEVSASRNGRTAVVRSAPFARDPVAPRAVIALPRRPDDGSPVPLALNDQVSLTGYGFSPDAPPVRDDSLTWVVVDAGGAETAIGSGGSLIVPVPALPPGTSTIHLRLAGGTPDQILVERPAGEAAGPGPVGGP